MQNKILVTGGAGFIGSNFVRHCVSACGLAVNNVDKLTYAGNLGSLSDLQEGSAYTFTHADINDAPAMRSCWPSSGRLRSSISLLRAM